MPPMTLTPAEVVTRGREIYEREIRARVEPASDGKFIVIDIESSDFEVDGNRAAAADRLLARHPQAVIAGLRVGRQTAVRLGGASAGQGHA